MIDHTVDVHLTFEEAGKIFSNEVVPCYISTTNEQEFQFLHIFPKIWNGHLLLLLFSHSTRCSVLSPFPLSSYPAESP